MAVIGYAKAKKLMHELDWKMLVTMVCDSVMAIGVPPDAEDVAQGSHRQRPEAHG